MRVVLFQTVATSLLQILHVEFVGNFGELQCVPLFDFPLHFRQKVVDPPFMPSQYVLQEAIVFCLRKGKFVLVHAIKT
jgi:hypothetical protein